MVSFTSRFCRLYHARTGYGSHFFSGTIVLAYHPRPPGRGVLCMGHMSHAGHIIHARTGYGWEGAISAGLNWSHPRPRGRRINKVLLLVVLLSDSFFLLEKVFSTYHPRTPGRGFCRQNNSKVSDSLYHARTGYGSARTASIDLNLLYPRTHGIRSNSSSLTSESNIVSTHARARVTLCRYVTTFFHCIHARTGEGLPIADKKHLKKMAQGIDLCVKWPVFGSLRSAFE